MRKINDLDFFEGLYRQNAATAVMAWLDGKDYTFDALDSLVQEITCTDDDEKLDEESQTIYAETYDAIGDCLVHFGCDPQAVHAFLEEESDDRGLRLGSYLEDSPDFQERTDYDLIDTFITGEGGEIVQEAIERVIRDGQLVTKKKRKKKRRLSGAQRAGLAKARRKSNTGAAKRNRMKSMKRRSSRGL